MDLPFPSDVWGQPVMDFKHFWTRTREKLSIPDVCVLFAVLCDCGNSIRMLLKHLRPILRTLTELIGRHSMVADAQTAIAS